MEEDERVVLFLRRVANAVILRALNDLRFPKDTYRFITARNFCLGVNKIWYSSLETWAQLADLDIQKIQKEARKRIDVNRR